MSAQSETVGRVQVVTSQGAVEGTVAHGAERFLGVPYAAPPFGARRFAPPRPVEPWAGVRDATRYGATAPQSPYPGALAALLPTVTVAGDGVLHLNVFTPADRGTDLLPVVVWVHGGSLAHGSNALAGYDGTRFAQDGVVFVGVNYRLGAEGFSVLDGAPRNLGLADQLAALRWVQDEVAAFGGDPRRVTLAGQSAGGNTVSAILAHPSAPDLVARAIVQSGPLSAQPAARAGRITRAMGKDLGVPMTRAGFATVLPEALVGSQDRVTAGSTPLTGGPGFALVLDDDLVPREPHEALTAGAGSTIPLLIGATTEEYRLWFVPTGLLSRFRWWHLAVARRKVGISARAVRLFRRNRPGASAGELLGALATDVLLRVPLQQVADSRRSADAETFVYEFAWRSPVQDLGAAHAVELGFVFDGLATPDSTALAGPEAPQSLATAMHGAWVAFATSGDPGWQRWDETRPVRVFDGEGDPVVLAPRDDERAALDAR
ncbi:carboxylesterase/lipase family protein [Oerskovia merdavium]|uniref:Carboxylic ester hydrolase n=1 Tax=Oerskovia merdavium TaxID=2762227 RepID=A0ABR8U463_9CELL|nr:carboxylesterase family protein [Oerskovia merdavium]MBD7982818.1 carboxylesterase family protein [Oerskovia merdavium]